MRVKLLVLFCLCCMLQATTCDESPPAGYITVRNTDDESFSFAYSFREVPPIQNYLTVESWTNLEPGEEKALPYSDYDFEGQKKFYLYIYKQSTLNDYTRDEAEQQGLYDARLHFYEDELDAMGFVIGYDGN